MRMSSLGLVLSSLAPASLVVPLVVGGLATAAHAEPPRATRMIDVAIATGSAPTNLSLSVADHSCSEAGSARGDERVNIKICHEGGEPAAPIYAFEVRRESGRGASQRFEARARVAPGARVVIGKLDQQGVAVDVSATISER